MMQEGKATMSESELEGPREVWNAALTQSFTCAKIKGCWVKNTFGCPLGIPCSFLIVQCLSVTKTSGILSNH